MLALVKTTKWWTLWIENYISHLPVILAIAISSFIEEGACAIQVL